MSAINACTASLIACAHVSLQHFAETHRPCIHACSAFKLPNWPLALPTLQQVQLMFPYITQKATNKTCKLPHLLCS